MDFIIENLKKNPAIRLILPFIIGIVLAIKINIGLVLPISICAISIAIIIFSFFNKKYYNLSFGIGINIFLFSIGILLVQLANRSGEINEISKLKEGNSLIIGEIEKEPKIKEKTITVNLNIKAIKVDNKWQNTSGKTILYLENDSLAQKLMVGDIIALNPKLKEIEDSGNPEAFNYKQYLSYNLISTSAFVKSEEWTILENPNSIPLRLKLLRFRTTLIDLLKENGIENDELDVLSALALGYADNISSEIRHHYSSSGAMHILAVSGLHVGIIYGIIVFLFKFIKNKKFEYVKIPATIILIWIYAMLTGLSPSVMRSSIMFSIIAIGNLSKNNGSSLNTVAVSAFILLIINPYNLMNVGFQLSYIAVIGILIFQQPFQNLYAPRTKFGKWIWSLTCVSIAAQLATAPICIYYFNQFSNYFLITNYLLIPISTVAIWICIAVWATSFIPIVSNFLAQILIYVIKAMNFSVAFIDNLPFSVLNNIYIDLPQVFIFYLAIIFIFIYFFVSKNHKHFFAFVASVIIFAGINLLQDFMVKNQKTILVYNINKLSAINIIDDDKNLIFANLEKLNKEKLDNTAKGLWLKKGVDGEKYIDIAPGKNNIITNLVTIDNKNIYYKNNFISFYDKKIYILDNNFKTQNTQNNNRIKVDFILVSNNPEIELGEIKNYFEYDKIIIDGSNSPKNIEKWEEENIEEKNKIFFTTKSGAFIFSLNNKK